VEYQLIIAYNMNLYINSVNFSTATTVYLDEPLTLVAPDGYYSDGTNYRQQISGVLVDVIACPTYSTELSLHLGTCVDVFFPDYTYYVYQAAPNIALNDGNIVYFDSGFVTPIDV